MSPSAQQLNAFLALDNASLRYENQALRQRLAELDRLHAELVERYNALEAEMDRQDEEAA
jgi:regulator of replication initiation timing